MAEAALKQDDKVVATLRKPEVLNDHKTEYTADQLLIEAAFAKAKDTFGRVDVMFNNAGFGLLARSRAHQTKTRVICSKLNFCGAASVTGESLKYFRDDSPIGGRLLQLSSYFAKLSAPGAEKAGLEVLTEALVKELDPAWNIKLTVIEPELHTQPTQTKLCQQSRLPIHKDAISYARVKGQALLDTADKWQSWSDDMYH
ncbi:hypothetical protein B0H34DRAFT_782652 [Crassisporium funariophilum]|nr:hypothetical protein B0H34DRAFT_782652 [Crassisporium funariophilum]